MTYRCHACGRSLRAYSVTVTTAAGVRGYGPVCGRAVAADVRPRRKAEPLPVLRIGRAVVIEGQMALEFAA